AGAALSANAATPAGQPSTSVQSAASAATNAAALPHGKCPSHYKLDFVQNRWIRCGYQSAASSAPKMTPFAAPTCDAGYALRDAAASNAPERNLYQCVKS
ncbi:MAG: hypothetical protein ABL931_14425, partial [Usitatibacteraceae bacterium]